MAKTGKPNLIAIAWAAAFMIAVVSPGAFGQGLTAPAQKLDIEKIVRDYLLNNPEIVVEAIGEYKRRQAHVKQQATRQLIVSRRDEIERDPGSPAGGNPKGDVSVVEFFDYQCGVCRRVHSIVAELVKSDPGIRHVYKEWPILGAGSVLAASAALASRKQGKYLVFHDALMTAGGKLTGGWVWKIAGSVGLDVTRLRRDMGSKEISEILKRNHALAEALKLRGTPSFAIGDELLRGGRDLEGMRAVVAKVRKGS